MKAIHLLELPRSSRYSPRRIHTNSTSNMWAGRSWFTGVVSVGVISRPRVETESSIIGISEGAPWPNSELVKRPRRRIADRERGASVNKAGLKKHVLSNVYTFQSESKLERSI